MIRKCVKHWADIFFPRDNCILMRWIHGSCCQAAYLTFSQTTCLLLRLSVLFCPRLCPLCDNTLTPGVFQHAAITRHKELYSTRILSSGPCSIAHMLLTMFHFDVSDVKIGQRWKLMNQPPKRPAIIIWPPFSRGVFLFLLVMKHMVHVVGIQCCGVVPHMLSIAVAICSEHLTHTISDQEICPIYSEDGPKSCYSKNRDG